MPEMNYTWLFVSAAAHRYPDLREEDIFNGVPVFETDDVYPVDMLEEALRNYHKRK